MADNRPEIFDVLVAVNSCDNAKYTWPEHGDCPLGPFAKEAEKMGLLRWNVEGSWQDALVGYSLTREGRAYIGAEPTLRDRAWSKMAQALSIRSGRGRFM